MHLIYANRPFSALEPAYISNYNSSMQELVSLKNLLKVSVHETQQNNTRHMQKARV